MKNQKIHVFTDELGGRFRYNDEPGRLSWLIQQDKKGQRKRKPTAGAADIRMQAEWYANHILETGNMTLVFWPLKKNMTASPNQFRFRVLKALGIPCPYWGPETRKLRVMMNSAITRGYTIEEYNDDVL